MSVKPMFPPNGATAPGSETDRFKDFTRRILSVPHSEIKAQLDAEKAAKKTSKTSASGRASRPKT
jgi:hypothetical protein